MSSPSQDSSRPQSFFATTRWTLIGEAAADGPAAEAALAEIFRTYWTPLYRYARRLGRSPEDAEDGVQGFFAELLERGGLRLADRDRGRFRAFLCGSLRHYLTDEWRREHRLKRGGGVRLLSLDLPDAETGLTLEPLDPRSPDRWFDREWALALLDKVLDDLAADEEQGQDYARWKDFLSLASSRITYAEAAARFGLSEGAARVAVHRLRKRYRQRLRQEIARTLTHADSVEEEMQALFAALAEEG